MAAARPVVVSTPVFRLAIIVNAIICGATFAGMIVLALWGSNPMTKSQDTLLAVCEKAFMMTTGAFLGLLGGRAANPETK